jgi:hypothetical protein
MKNRLERRGRRGRDIALEWSLVEGVTGRAVDLAGPHALIAKKALIQFPRRIQSLRTDANLRYPEVNHAET